MKCLAFALLSLLVPTFAAASALQADESSQTMAPTTFEGFVTLQDGTPVANASVVSSAGGECFTNADGAFQLEVSVPREAETVELFATYNSADGTSNEAQFSGNASVAPVAFSSTSIGSILVAPGPLSNRWLTTFGEQPGSKLGGFRTVVSHVNGQKRELYVGGGFSSIGGVKALSVARWSENRWSPLGKGTNGYVHALEIFDDGNGPALYAGGNFSKAGDATVNNIAKWDGSSWTPLSSGITGTSFPTVYDLVAFDDGNGPALYVAGIFKDAGGVQVSSIAKWDGTVWSAVGTKFTQRTYSLTVYDDGSGGVLCAGGIFNDPGVSQPYNVATWDGVEWTALGTGMAREVSALRTFDDGNGPKLYVGGKFTSVDGVNANYVASWNGSNWEAMGSGVSGGGSGSPNSPFVDDFVVYDDGTGPALYAGGDFEMADGKLAPGLAKWDGSSWSAVGGSFNQNGFGVVDKLTILPTRTGLKLVAVGDFRSAGGVTALSVAGWNGNNWSGFGTGVDTPIRAMATFDDGTGTAFYAGGDMTTAGGETITNSIAKWDGEAWSAFGNGVPNQIGGPPEIDALHVYDDGSGPALFAAGYFKTIDSVPCNNIARWNGTSWNNLNFGIPGIAVNDLVSFDDGFGTKLYAAGQNTFGPGIKFVARWDGASWDNVGFGASGDANALAVYDDGNGPALYIAGNFLQAAGVPANHIAKWNGTEWSELGMGLGGEVLALCVYDDGTGEALYAGGRFQTAGGQFILNIARWEGTRWTAVGSGLNQDVTALEVVDLGSGPVLVASGSFTMAGNTAVKRIASWNGLQWLSLGRALPDKALVMSAFNDVSGPSLLVGGDFRYSPGGDSFIARFGSE